MIDIRYHVATIVAVFIALGLGVLIGSTIVGDSLLVEQQNLMIDRLEEQFNSLRERESQLAAANESKNQIISNYENYSQAMLPSLVDKRMQGYRVSVVVTGDSEIPAGMINALSIAGVEVLSKTVVLSNMKLDNQDMREQIKQFYGIEDTVSRDVLREHMAATVAAVLMNQNPEGAVPFLQNNDLVKFSGNYEAPADGVILVGGAAKLENYFARSFDQATISHLVAGGIKVFGVESSGVAYSAMMDYQQNNISTVDNIDMSPGQISLILTMEGEAGHYGIKETAQKFMPTIPVGATT